MVIGLNDFFFCLGCKKQQSSLITQ